MKTILLTGATDGMGALAAEHFARAGHALLVHGRDPQRVARAVAHLQSLPGAGPVGACVADLARPTEVLALARGLASHPTPIDVLIHNAGVFRAPQAHTEQGWDLRLAVNTLAPMLLTEVLWPRLAPKARVVAVSSAAQAPVEVTALARGAVADPMRAYAQSKLALIHWVRHLAERFEGSGRVALAVNPGSMLASKMVREGFGVAGRDLAIGANALVRAALDPDFAGANGAYFDNDAGRLADPHPDALQLTNVHRVVAQLQALIAPFL